MEICYRCGKTIKLNNAFERPSHLFENEFYCSECYEKVNEEFCLKED